jgi:hypothetical protein
MICELSYATFPGGLWFFWCSLWESGRRVESIFSGTSSPGIIVVFCTTYTYFSFYWSSIAHLSPRTLYTWPCISFHLSLRVSYSRRITLACPWETKYPIFAAIRTQLVIAVHSTGNCAYVSTCPVIRFPCPCTDWPGQGSVWPPVT